MDLILFDNLTHRIRRVLRMRIWIQLVRSSGSGSRKAKMAGKNLKEETLCFELEDLENKGAIGHPR